MSEQMQWRERGTQIISWFQGGTCVEFKVSIRHLEGDFKWLVGMHGSRPRSIYQVRETAIICMHTCTHSCVICMHVIAWLPRNIVQRKEAKKGQILRTHQNNMRGQRKKPFCSFKIEVNVIEEPQYYMIRETKWESFKNRIIVFPKKEIC